MKRWFSFILLAAALSYLAAPSINAAGELPASNMVRRDAGSWAAVCSAMPGERVDCRAVFYVRGDRGYIARGQFSDGVDLQRVTALRQNGEDINASYYTTIERLDAGKKHFEIHFAPGWSDAKEVCLEIEYAVSLNEQAGTGEQDNRCAVELAAADGSALSGEEAYLHTYAFACYRAMAIPDTIKQSNPLTGACFSLYRDKERTRRVAFAAGRGGVYTACTGENCDHSRHTFLLKTPENGTLRLRGLGAGIYYLQETRAPKGCGVSADSLEIVLSENGTVTAGGVDVPEGMIKLIEPLKAEPKKEEESDPLAFYEKGCKVLSTVMAALLMARKQLFR